MANVLASVLLLVALVTVLISPRPKPLLEYEPLAALATEPIDAGAHLRLILDSQRPTGALAMTPQQLLINPYFANLAAVSLLRFPGNLDAVRRHLEWYLANLNPDGTIDDFEVKAGVEIPTGDADSTDSYAATLLSLVARWLEAGGDAGWVEQHLPGLERVAGAIVAVTDADGLTWAKPGYPRKLLMDNCEVYSGWRDWAQVLRAVGLTEAAAIADQRADRIRAALPRFQGRDGTWYWSINRWGPRSGGNLKRFYPDAVAQVFPLMHGLAPDPSGYYALQRAHPDWWRLKSADFPWMLLSHAAFLAGDVESSSLALRHATVRHSDLAWPWFNAESGWLLLNLPLHPAD